MAKLNVNIGGLELKNPVMTASGTFGYGVEFQDFVSLEDIGGIIVKGTTLNHREGNDYPRMAETASGMLNCVGLQNKGVDYFCEHIYPEIKDIKTNFIVNVSGSSPEDYGECAARINDLENIPAIELNISCPNVKHGGMAFGTSAEGAASVVREVRKSLLSIGTGGLSGPAVKPVALRMVHQVSKAVKIPVIGLGGICTAKDAIEFFMAGATAIEIGTANFLDPAVTVKVRDGIDQWLDSHGCESIKDIIGVIE